MPNAQPQPDVVDRALGQGRGKTDATGPSWYDVRRLACDLERLYGRRVGFELGPKGAAGSWDSSTVHVRAWLSVAGPWAEDTVWASSSFGGASGYRTLAAACHDALSWLWTVAAQRGAFMDI
jgi:hypothetical protein